MELSLEDIFLVDLCKWFAGRSDRPTYVASKNWGSLFQTAHAQKIDRLLARFLLSPPGFKGLPYWFAQDLLAASARRSSALTDELIRVQSSLRDHGIDSLARKGAAYDLLLYGGAGLRTYFDNDLYVRPEHRDSIPAILEGLGYSVGKFSAEQVKFVSLPREEAILYRLRPDHLPHYFKTSDRPFSEAVSIDVAFDMAWHGSEYSRYTGKILEQEFASPTRLGNLTTLSMTGHFVDCVMHAFREAYHERTIRERWDVSLRKFLDVWLLWDRMDSSQRSLAREWVTAGPLAPIFGWIMQHLDAVFDTNIWAELNVPPIVNEIELNSWKSDQGIIGSWEGTMLQRIFGKAEVCRAASHAGAAPVAG